MARVEDLGGAVAAIEQGYQKGEIEQSAYAVTREIDSGERFVVGVNRFTIDDRGALRARCAVDLAIEASRPSGSAKLRNERGRATPYGRRWPALQAAARGTDNCLPPMKEALAALRDGG